MGYLDDHPPSPCGGCGVAPGEQHGACDWALCMYTGEQLIMCRGDAAGFHDCGAHVHDGYSAGTLEAVEHGWFHYWVGPAPGEQYGTFVPCTEDHPQAQPDLGRVRLALVWDRQSMRHVSRERCRHESLDVVTLEPDDEPAFQVGACARCGVAHSDWMWAMLRRPIRLDGPDRIWNAGPCQ